MQTDLPRARPSWISSPYPAPRSQTPSKSRPGEGYEYVMTLTALGLVGVVLGPGEWFVDDHVDGLA